MGVSLIGDGQSIVGNVIGTSVDGDPLGNDLFGIGYLAAPNPLPGNASGNTIAGNIIADNAAVGVFFDGGGSSGGTTRALAATATPSPATRSMAIPPRFSCRARARTWSPMWSCPSPPTTPERTGPELATAAGGSTTIVGSFDGLANADYSIEFFASDAVDAAGNGEGQTFLGVLMVQTDSSGHATISDTFARTSRGSTSRRPTPGEPRLGRVGERYLAVLGADLRAGPALVRPSADLAVAASVVTAAPVALQPLELQFVVTNNGPGAATDATLVVTLPDDASDVSSDRRDCRGRRPDRQPRHAGQRRSRRP